MKTELKACDLSESLWLGLVCLVWHKFCSLLLFFFDPGLPGIFFLFYPLLIAWLFCHRAHWWVRFFQALLHRGVNKFSVHLSPLLLAQPLQQKAKWHQVPPSLHTSSCAHLAVLHFHCSCLTLWFFHLWWIFTLIQEKHKYVFVFFFPRSAQPHLSLWHCLLSITCSAFPFHHLPTANLCLISAASPPSQLKSRKYLLEFI